MKPGCKAKEEKKRCLPNSTYLKVKEEILSDKA